MPLAAGTRLGRYEVVSPLGAGGMGEVYRARDPQLGRDVAVKIVSGDDQPSAERLQRFEREARAVAALDHPGILAVHDVGSHDGRAYVVFELLEGETLRDRLARGTIPVRKAIDIAVDACRALGTAHAHGVVHRDLKPENLFLVREGRVKLLDFGLARLTQAAGIDEGPAITRTETDRAQWMGTPGYVSPEQLRAAAADARSDIFALGAVLYEMLSGRRAFHGDTRADTLAAILDKDPPPMSVVGGVVPAPLERIVLRCLEKEPDDRFQSVRDVAFALEALSSGSTSATAAAIASARPLRRWLWLAAGLSGAMALAAATFVAGRRSAEKPPPVFKQLTFRRGWLDYARFAPDGRTVIYGAGWDGKPVELFQTRTDSPESKPLGLSHAKVLSISSQGQMAVLLDQSRSRGYFFVGTLAVLPLAGGTPRELLEDVREADWTPDGRELCVARRRGNGEVTVELPPGKVLHRTRGYVYQLRVSRDGRHIVFQDGGAGALVIIDRERGAARPLVRMKSNFWGLAWGPTGRDVWFTEGDTASTRDVFAVDLEGRRRLVYRSAGVLGLIDSAPDGRILLHRSIDRAEAMALLPGGSGERDVTVYGESYVGAVSGDGQLLLLNSPSAGAGPRRSVYLRRDGGDPIRVAEGEGVALSSDGKAALVLNDMGELNVVPIGPGLPQKVDLGPLRVIAGAWVAQPTGPLIVLGRERSDAPRSLWLVERDGAKPRKVGMDAPLAWTIAPDGHYLAVQRELGTVTILPLGGGLSRNIRGLAPGLQVRRWGVDGRSLFFVRLGGWPCEIHRLDLSTERAELWRQATPPDPIGMMYCNSILPSADGRSYAYSVGRSITSLIVAEGLR